MHGSYLNQEHFTPNSAESPEGCKGIMQLTVGGKQSHASACLKSLAVSPFLLHLLMHKKDNDPHK